MTLALWAFSALTRALKEAGKVFSCYSICEKMKDYKKLILIMWINYKQLCNSVVGKYFKGSSDVIEVTMATGQLYKKDI